MRIRAVVPAFRAIFAAGLLTLAGLWTACGGSGQQIFQPPPTITSVAVSCTPTSIQTSQTSQCTPTVKGTGSFSSAVTFTASIGSISASGLFTAPASAGTATITAKSTADPTKSGTATVTVTVPPPPISVVVTPPTATVTSAGTKQFTATVSNDSSNAGVTWSATAGTVSTSGLFTAPTVTAQTTVTVKATSKADTTKSDSATVTVTPGSSGCGSAITITSVTPASLFIADDQTLLIGVLVQGTGFAAGDTVHVTDYNDSTLPTGVQTTQFSQGLSIGTRGYMPRWLDFSVSCGTVTSNTKTIAFYGNQNTLALDTAGNLFQLDQAQAAPSGQNGYVRKFLANGTANGSFFAQALDHGISVDDKTGDIDIDSGAYDVNGNFVNQATSFPPSEGIGTAAKSGLSCTTQPLVSDLSCYDLTQSFPPGTTVTAGQEPWSLAMATLGSGSSAEVDAVLYDREGTQMLRYRTSDMSHQGGFVVNGLTPASQLPALTGGWQVVVFNSGPGAGKGALLSQSEKLLIGFDVKTMTEIWRVSLSGIPFRIAADETHGTVIVANADVNAKLTRFSKVNATSGGTPVSLSSTTPLLAVGLAISPNGANIDACMQAQCSVLPNQ